MISGNMSKFLKIDTKISNIYIYSQSINQLIKLY